MLITLLGIVILVKFLQSSKAPHPIPVTFFPLIVSGIVKAPDAFVSQSVISIVPSFFTSYVNLPYVAAYVLSFIAKANTNASTINGNFFKTFFIYSVLSLLLISKYFNKIIILPKYKKVNTTQLDYPNILVT